MSGAKRSDPKVNHGITEPQAEGDALHQLVSASTTEYGDALQACLSRMQHDGQPAAVCANFERLFKMVARGETGVIAEETIVPVGVLPHLNDIRENSEYQRIGRSLLESLVVIRLNGGLATTMGLTAAKSTLPVKDGLTFNDLIARQLLMLREMYNCNLPLLHMTSPSTDADVCSAMSRYQELQSPELPTTFSQHRHPKIYADTLFPVTEFEDNLCWNPPGHGDIYAALLATGIIEQLQKLGKKYIFVANSDNLGATVEPAILGFMASCGADFLMETAERTEADSKGGHLARRRSDGQLLLRETAQAPKVDGVVIPAFGDITRYEHFNTNNLWIQIDAVANKARECGGCIPLPLISNPKPVDPRVPTSRKVIQIETAMGAAIEEFNGAVAIRVGRERFAPVKTNGDLMVVRSDAYRRRSDGVLVCDSVDGKPPVIQLDPRHYGVFSDYSERVTVTPSLREANSLRIKGDVRFMGPVKIKGDVSIEVADGTSLVLPRRERDEVLENETIRVSL